MASQIKECWKNFIDGDWVDGSTNETIPVINPATREQISEVARATPEDIDLAVAAARAAYDRRTLYDMRPSQRGELMLEVARILKEMLQSSRGCCRSRSEKTPPIPE